MAVTVLNPAAATVKIVRANVEKPIEGFPIELMGPAVAEGSLVQWCRNNLDKLDRDIVDTALLQAAAKTLKKNGFGLEKQRLHRSVVYRLVANNLIAEGTTITKEE
jgi:hypothetical protein